MTQKVSFNPKRDLPYIAAFAQAAQFALAGSVLIGPKGWFFGGLLGLLVSLAVAYAASQYTDVAKKRQPWAMAGMVIIGIISPLIVGTSLYLDLSKELHPVWRGVVGAAWGILPDASVALVGFIAGKGLSKADEATEKPAKAEPKPAKPVEVPALPIIAPLVVAQSYACKYGCGDERASQQAMNAHYRGCKMNPANMPIRVDVMP